MKSDFYPRCGTCAHFIGGGDWGLCCPHISYLDLVYKWTNANESCDNKYERNMDMCKTLDEIKLFYTDCVHYWANRVGDSVEVAMAKALWWDCAECWNIDKSWDEPRIEFFAQMAPEYKPYDPIPDLEELHGND